MLRKRPFSSRHGPLRPEDAVLVLDVVGLVERPEADELLERLPAEPFVHVAQHFHLVREERVGLRPGAHVDHRADEIRPRDGDLLADAGAEPDQPDEMHVLPAEMIEQAGDIAGMCSSVGATGHVVA